MHSLTSVTIPSSVTNIANNALEYCASLNTITVDPLNSVYSSMDGVLFDKSQTTLIHCSEGKVRNLYDSKQRHQHRGLGVRILFRSDQRYNPQQRHQHRRHGFYCSGLTSVTIGNGVSSIGGLAFNLCNLTSVTIPDSVTSIGGVAFESCGSLINVTIANGVTSIGDSAFDNCTGLTSVTIPDSVTSIGDWAFSSCSSLTSVTIPDSVTSIGG